MAELVDATDLKSVEDFPRASSILASGTTSGSESPIESTYQIQFIKKAVFKA